MSQLVLEGGKNHPTTIETKLGGQTGDPRETHHLTNLHMAVVTQYKGHPLADPQGQGEEEEEMVEGAMVAEEMVEESMETPPSLTAAHPVKTSMDDVDIADAEATQTQMPS